MTATPNTPNVLSDANGEVTLTWGEETYTLDRKQPIDGLLWSAALEFDSLSENIVSAARQLSERAARVADAWAAGQTATVHLRDDVSELIVKQAAKRDEIQRLIWLRWKSNK